MIDGIFDNIENFDDAFLDTGEGLFSFDEPEEKDIQQIDIFSEDFEDANDFEDLDNLLGNDFEDIRALDDFLDEMETGSFEDTGAKG